MEVYKGFEGGGLGGNELGIEGSDILDLNEGRLNLWQQKLKLVAINLQQKSME